MLWNVDVIGDDWWVDIAIEGVAISANFAIRTTKGTGTLFVLHHFSESFEKTCRTYEVIFCQYVFAANKRPIAPAMSI
jgi:hypothetical protein